LTDNNYDFLANGEPTYWPSDPKNIPDLLDFVVTSGITRNNCTIESNSDLTSDHTPVITILSTTIIKNHLLLNWLQEIPTGIPSSDTWKVM
jgi:hypothetical protein